MKQFNMQKLKQYESGQAIVFVAMIMIILLGATGLAIDGGTLLLQRRDVQNALDHGTLAATLSLCAGGDAVSAGTQAVRVSGYDDASPRQTVAVESPPTNTYTDNASAIGSTDYALIHIEAERDSYFIQLVYPGQLGVSMTAIGYCKPAVTAFGGFSFAALSKTSSKAFDLSGNANTKWCGGGAISGAGAEASNNASSGLTTMTGCDAPTWESSGSFAKASNLTSKGYTVNQNTGTNITDPFALLDPPVCTHTYSGAVPASGHTVDGVECWDSITCTNGGTTTINANGGDGTSDVIVLSGGMTDVKCAMTLNNVMVYVNGDFRSNAGGSLNHTAPIEGEWSGFMMWLTGTDLRINGSASGDLTGTIYAPDATAVYNGGSDSTFKAQLIADTIDFAGGNDSNVIYDDDFFFEIPPQIEVVQ